MAMASLCTKILTRGLRPGMILPCRTMADKEYAPPLELATGLEKRELLAKLAGNDDPYQMKVTKRSAGTLEQPNLVQSAFDQRIVGCICEEDACTISFMWLHKGAPKRCECGHWFKLIETKPI